MQHVSLIIAAVAAIIGIALAVAAYCTPRYSVFNARTGRTLNVTSTRWMAHLLAWYKKGDYCLISEDRESWLYHCPSCGDGGVKDADCPSCPGWSFEPQSPRKTIGNLTTVITADAKPDWTSVETSARNWDGSQRTDMQMTISHYIGDGRNLSGHTQRCLIGMIETGEATYADFNLASDQPLMGDEPIIGILRPTSCTRRRTKPFIDDCPCDWCEWLDASIMAGIDTSFDGNRTLNS